MWTLKQAIAAVGGQLIGADVEFIGITTDSRTDCQGRLFIALTGPNHDGHAHVAAAMAAGAVAAMVSRRLDIDLPQWQVADPHAGLIALAAAWRAQAAAQIVAVTGSNGKTTVKEMLAAILSEAGTTLATQGNLNNNIGVPLTLLRLRDEAYAVIEMGANHHGEIAELTALARPQVALITNAGRAHLEGFGSLEGVAHAKGEIASGLPADGVFVFMADTPFTDLWQRLADGRRTLTFGLTPQAEVSADPAAIHSTWDREGFRTCFAVQLPCSQQPLHCELALAGQHNVVNALAAIATASALEVPPTAIQNGLAKVRPVGRRLQPRTGNHGLRILDDSYNANPDSFQAALEVLQSLSGRAVLVLGDFGELGAESRYLHARMGEQARAAGVTRLYALGSLAAQAASAFGAGGVTSANAQELIAQLQHELQPEDVVLIKGSRLAGMDRVVDALSGLKV